MRDQTTLDREATTLVETSKQVEKSAGEKVGKPFII